MRDVKFNFNFESIVEEIIVKVWVLWKRLSRGIDYWVIENIEDVI